MEHRRTSYQSGSLTIAKRKKGPDVWTFQWRERCADGSSIKRKRTVGTLAELPTKAAAERAVAGQRVDINALSAAPVRPMTLADVAEHYKLVELPERDRSARTQQTYRFYIDQMILPKWGSHRLGDVKTVLVERWLRERSDADGTKSKCRAVMSILFRHAMSYEWTDRNPIALVRQSAKRQTEPVILDVSEVQNLLEEMRNTPEPFRTLVIVAVVTGLRRGELFGLKWQDVDFARAQIRVTRSLVNGIEGKPKTAASRRPVPLTLELADILHRWRSQTRYAADGDWVFASPEVYGRMPYWPDSVLYKRIRPAAIDAGITKRIGWHSFRRTTASLLLSSGASIRTVQENMRHQSAEMTLGVYAQSTAPERLAAQQTIATLLLPPSAPSNQRAEHVSC